MLARRPAPRTTNAAATPRIALWRRQAGAPRSHRLPPARRYASRKLHQQLTFVALLSHGDEAEWWPMDVLRRGSVSGNHLDHAERSRSFGLAALGQWPSPRMHGTPATLPGARPQCFPRRFFPWRAWSAGHPERRRAARAARRRLEAQRKPARCFAVGPRAPRGGRSRRCACGTPPPSDPGQRSLLQDWPPSRSGVRPPPRALRFRAPAPPCALQGARRQPRGAPRAAKAAAPPAFPRSP
mmetsp:Transcript_107641/g.303182  ORF Transcript_107641/g.303182 Transcript_107641/m.303182 type:complete len:240 (+) Transcript_107641:688-1407(+)